MRVRACMLTFGFACVRAHLCAFAYLCRCSCAVYSLDLNHSAVEHEFLGACVCVRVFFCECVYVRVFLCACLRSLEFNVCQFRAILAHSVLCRVIRLCQEEETAQNQKHIWMAVLKGQIGFCGNRLGLCKILCGTLGGKVRNFVLSVLSVYLFFFPVWMVILQGFGLLFLLPC